ncbi:hypothetical protein BH11BAC7_BH11BAC7_15880 [soil metagenome]
MKGVSYVTDNKRRLKAVQIDIKIIENHQEESEDFLAIIIASSRKGESSSSLQVCEKPIK